VLAEMGLLGLTIPEEFGGFSGSHADVMLVMEQFGRGLVLEPYLASAVIGAGLIAAAGSHAQKQKYLPPMAAGELKTALATLEPQGRFDLYQVQTTASLNDGGYTINGSKCVVAGGACAGLIIVSARTRGSPADPNGISLFLVDTTTRGVSVKDYPSIDATRTAEIGLENVIVPNGALLGEEGEGLEALEKAVDRGIAGLCAEALGAMSRLAEITAEYLRTRTQFGSPIGKFQALQHGRRASPRR
jgi:alkylation response protein AidB-like acyl-CoA dehydrogenase